MFDRISFLKVTVVSWFKSRLEVEAGASLVEYALLLALIAVVAIGALVLLGKNTATTLNTVANNVG